MASAVDPRLFDARVKDDRLEITPQGVQQTYVHGRVISTAGLSKPAPLTVIVVRVYSLPQGNSMSFNRIFSGPSRSIPCVASSAITWVNLPTVGGQPTRMYQLRQWACNRHSVHGRTGSITGLQWNGRSFFQIYH